MIFMDFPRVVLGYHGCLEPLASDLLSGRKAVADWPVSRNKWDWLGEGIYFWEHGPARALKWAEARAKAERAKGRRVEPAVIGAIISLGDDVLDLTDVRATSALKHTFTIMKITFEKAGRKLPENETSGYKRHSLDCIIINGLLYALKEDGKEHTVVRGAFEEGEPAFPGSTIREQTHIQLAVRKPGVIRGLFKPTF
jgi:hypothetical protein